MDEESSSSNQKVQAILDSYLDAQDEIDNQSVQKLTQFLNQQQLGDFSSQQIQKRLDQIQQRNQKIMIKRRTIAELFAQDHQVRKIRFGSAFCPQCHMFKNYDKECPYCQFLEITY